MVENLAHPDCGRRHRRLSRKARAEMGGRVNHDFYPDAYIRSILATVKTIAMVGASANSARPSYMVLKYLIRTRVPLLPSIRG